MAKSNCAIGMLVAIFIILIAIIAFETWKISKLSSSLDEAINSHSPNSTTQIPPKTTKNPPIPPPSGEFQFLSVNLSETSILHVWLKAATEFRPANFYAQNEKGEKIILATTTDAEWFNFWEISMQKEGPLEFAWHPADTVLSYFYSFQPEKVMAKGICPIYISPQAKRPEREGSFHFRPPLGWNNDPNGFSRTADGKYHLFYQHYPHEKKWASMHWGHAVSDDLVNWVHQPIFLRPQRDAQGRVAHIYSGSAHSFPDGGLMLFYTDHMEGREIVEFQRSVVTKDLYRPMGPSRTIIPNRPAEMFDKLAWDFRDPKVFMGPPPENAYFMTLGSGRKNRTQGGVVLLYKQKNIGNKAENLEEWDYQGIVHEESRWGMDVCECSAIIPLQNPAHEDTLFVLNYGMQNSKDPEGRGSVSPIFVGTFNGRTFSPLFEQLLDFAADSYAYLPYYDSKSGEALIIGWLGNHWDGKSDFDAQITLPRTIKVSIDRRYLMTAPHDNLLNLREKEMDIGGLKTGKPLNLPASGTAEVEYKLKKLEKKEQILMTMVHSELGQDAILVKLNGEGLEIEAKWDHGKKIRRIARGANPSTLRIFIDQDSIEVFGDNGRWTGTLMIPAKGRILGIGFAGNLNSLESVKVWGLKATTKIQSKC